MDIDLKALLETFAADAEEHLVRMEESLLRLERGEGDAEEIASLFRRAHSLKGDAACVNLSQVSDFSHTVEDLLDGLRDGRIGGTRQIYGLLLEAVDVLRELVGAPGEGELRPAHEDVRRRLAEAAARDAAGPGAAASGPAPERAGGEGASEEPGARTAEGRRPSEQTLRIDVSRLDRLLDLVSEITIGRGTVRQLLEAGGASHGAALEAHTDLDRAWLELQESVLQARMVPLGPVLGHYERTVRDLAQARRRLVRLEVEGADVEVDTAMAQHVREPLLHLVRNAVDHGIEPPEVRKAAGKDPVGTVTLRASHGAGALVVEVVDDGAGLRRQAILERAKALGLVDEQARVEDVDLPSLVLQPALSTAEEVTAISGRGVGMDAVRKEVERLRGTLAIESREGEGTTVSIRLPLTLLIIEGFSVIVDGDTYVLPLEHVSECLDLPEGAAAGTFGTFDLRGRVLPFVRLRRFFGFGGGAPGRESVVVVQARGRSAGLVVDDLVGEHQAVVKPLARLLERAPGISASTVLGNGRVALILDVMELLSAVDAQTRLARAG